MQNVYIVKIYIKMQLLPEKRNTLNKNVHTYTDKVKMDGQTTFF